MTRGDRERARIVDFWRAVELFEPQKVDRPDPRGDTPVSHVEPGCPLPWERGHPVRRRPTPRNRLWRHTVYLGVFKVEQMHAILTDAFGTDPTRGDERPAGQAALAAFEVDEAGRALLASQALATCGWALGRTIAPGPRSGDWLEGFDWSEERFGELYDWLVSDPGPAPARALLTAVDGGLVSGPLVEFWEAIRTSLKLSMEMTGALSLPDAGKEVSASAEAEFSLDGSDSPPRLRAAGEGSRVLGYRDLEALQHTAARLLGVDRHLKLDIRVRSHTVSAKEHEAEQEHQEFLLAQQRGETDIPGDPFGDTVDSPLLNSFIAEDLDTVSTAVRKGEYGRALRTYLSSSAQIAALARTDVRQERGGAIHRVHPELTPAGRWPAKDIHPLVLSQQIAVNSITASLGEGAGVFAVNGPPGTGKTTLLRDLVANVVVERATVLASFAKPWEAFAKKRTGWDKERGRTSFPPLVPKLAGFEIVVASANNGAVDNVTQEIPGRKAVDERWAKADYFAATASNMVVGEEGAWGTLAAQLGNTSNRRNFVSRFWWGNRPDRAQTDQGMRTLLTALNEADRADPHPGQRGWREAVEAFNEARRERDRLATERAVVAEQLEEIPSARHRLQEAERLCQVWKRSADDSCTEHETRQRYSHQAFADLRGIEAERSQHWEFKPGFWDVLFSLGRRLREWQRTDDEILSRLRAAEAHNQECTMSEEKARHARERANQGLAEADRDRRTARSRLSTLEEALAAADRRWPGRVPVGEAVTDASERERSAPWSDPELTRARTEVFLAALALHEAFVRAVPGKMLQILRAAVEVLDGRAKHVRDEAAREALRGLFLVVPVMSSTFASFSRTFKAFDSESLGWLLVDEAGQATPQQVVGALWRSRRAVVVGDPLQLEPVTTLSLPAQEHLRKRFGVEKRWFPTKTSVQALADSVTGLGTLLERDEGEPLWVGCPLRVHRRSDDPMFTVSNTVAYGGMMVFGTPDRKALPLPESQWVHVPESGSEGHWRPPEGEKLRWLLHSLQNRYGHPMDEVFVLAPFRNVADRVRKISTGYGVRRDRTGTIHTSQGKEAEVVVFVLGGAPDREGALDWASQTPNLLNVAVSRAKRRLYVIGDHTAWAHRHHFKTLGQHLPLRKE